MNNQESYNLWASQYDNNKNRTRDVEALALKATLKDLAVENCLEIGCGTGKNTLFLVEKVGQITSVDFSEKMLEEAKKKVQSDKVTFVQSDITKSWNFANTKYDLITFSLVLEHIENLDFIFNQINEISKPNTLVYIGELHPFKQYSGTKARFDTKEGRQILDCYAHHVSDFTQLSKKYNFEILDLNEHFDDSDKTVSPRILTLLLRKK